VRLDIIINDKNYIVQGNSLTIQIRKNEYGRICLPKVIMGSRYDYLNLNDSLFVGKVHPREYN
jgi:hypothetical protein